MKRRAIFGALVALVALVPVAATPGAAEGRPSAVVDGPSTLTPGQFTMVSGQDWPARTNVNVELCGDAGSSSLACDTARGRTVGVGESGVFAATITASVPPKPCPCVIRVSSQNGSDRYAIPVEVIGAPVAPISEVLPQPGDEAVRIDGVRLEIERTLGEWFGAAPQRLLSFQVTNTGKDALRNLPIDVYTGSSPESGRHIDVEPIEVLEPGATTVVTAPVSFDPLTMGNAVVRGGIGGGQPLAAFETDTQSFPWGLLVVLLVLLQTGLVFGRNRVRRRLYPEPALVAAAVGVAEVGAATDVVGDPWTREAGVPLIVPLVPPVTAETEPVRTLELVLWAIDGVRASSAAPADTVAVVAVATRPTSDLPGSVAVRAAAFSPPVADHPWATPEGLDTEELTAGGGPVSPVIVDAIGGGRPVATEFDAETERRLTALASLVVAQLLALPAESGSPDVDIVVALVAVVGEISHTVVVELSTGTRDGAQVVMRTAHTA